MLGTNEQRAVAIYTKAIEEAKQKGLSRNEAKAIGKKAVYDALPDLHGKHVDAAPRLWAAVSNVINAHYPVRKVSVEKPKQMLVQPKIIAEDRENFADVVRSMAKTGFIPLPKYLAPVIGEPKAANISSYIFQFVKPFYEVTRNEYGYVCVSSNQREIDELSKQMEEIKKAHDDQMAALEKRINGLRNNHA